MPLNDLVMNDLMMDHVFSSAFYPALEQTLGRAESHGYETAKVVADAARSLQASPPAVSTELADPAVLLTQ